MFTRPGRSHFFLLNSCEIQHFQLSQGLEIIFFRNPTEIHDSTRETIAAKIASRTNSLTCFIYFIGTPWTCWYNKELTYWMTIKIYLESAYLDSLEYRSRIEGHQMNSFFKPQKWSLVVWGHIKTWTFPTVLGCPEQ